MKMKWKSILFVICIASGLVSGLPTSEKNENTVGPVHIIKPPIRCPDGMKPDANGRCRVVWERSIDAQDLCLDGEQPDEDGVCRNAEESLDCFEEECQKIKRDVQGVNHEETEIKKPKKLEALRSGKKIKKRSNFEDEKAGKQARSKHAFLIMLKKKKMQMMKPKPPPPPPPHHPPHHHPPHHEEPEEEPEEEPAEEDPPERLFFGDEACLDTENSTESCRPDMEVVEKVDANKEFKEWKPEKSSESLDSSSSSSSSDSTGESDSEGGSDESEDELLEKAIKIKLMKIFRMKQRYGPTLRRWLVSQLREYEDSLNY